jgi:hypothetical protein
MMVYNITQLQAADTIFKVVIYANDSTSGFVAISLLLAVFFITLMALKRYEFSKALLTSSIISFVISLLLNYAHLIHPVWSLIFLIVAAFTAMIGSVFD